LCQLYDQWLGNLSVPYLLPEEMRTPRKPGGPQVSRGKKSKYLKKVEKGTREEKNIQVEKDGKGNLLITLQNITWPRTRREETEGPLAPGTRSPGGKKTHKEEATKARVRNYRERIAITVRPRKYTKSL